LRKEIIQYITAQKDLQEFIRQQPHWYRLLSRDPHTFEQFERASLHFFEKTIPQRVEKFSNNLQMASMLMNIFYGLKTPKQ